MANKLYGLADLLYLMQRLRDPQTGCAWDCQQDFSSIVPHTLEEAYEVADAIERGDLAGLPAELGDLLFQVVFYAQMAAEQQHFDFADIVDTAVRKLLRRHPHVFPDGQLHTVAPVVRYDTEQLQQQWQQIKEQERAEQGTAQQPSALDAVLLNLPALTRAQKLQKAASRVGFDWDELSPVLDKLQEEIDELREAVAHQDTEAVTHELGDVLFSACNVARFVQVDAEQALRLTSQRFTQRFQYIEQSLRALGSQVSDTDADTLNRLWEEAKRSL